MTMKILNYYKQNKKQVHIAAALVFVFLVVVVFMSKRGDSEGFDGANQGLTVPVRQGPLVIHVVEAGTINPRERTVLKSELQGRSTILYLIDEGRRVKKGELLVELDASELVDQKVEQEIRVQNVEAEFIQAQEDLEVVKNQAEADVDQAQLQQRFAVEDLKKYQEGEYPNERKKLQSKITLAEEELERSRQKMEWSRRLYEEKYLSETELQADELAFKKAELELDLARSNLELFEEYTYKRTLDELTSDVRQAEMNLERVQRKARANVVHAEVKFRAKESELTQQRQKLEKLDEQISKAKIYAPSDGKVVYATSAQFNWRGDVEPLAEGQEVRERQELIHLPVADTFMSMVKIHESSLKKISIGMPVVLTVDALPGRVFSGTVAKIAPLPDPRSAFLNPDLKVYNTEINIDGGGDALRTGMTCEAEIVVKKYEEAVYVPLQCVVRIQGRSTVYVEEGAGKIVPRTVKTGLDNNRMIHIVDGLEPGEEVLLTPPLGNSGSGR